MIFCEFPSAYIISPLSFLNQNPHQYHNVLHYIYFTPSSSHALTLTNLGFQNSISWSDSHQLVFVLASEPTSPFTKSKFHPQFYIYYLMCKTWMRGAPFRARIYDLGLFHKNFLRNFPALWKVRFVEPKSFFETVPSKMIHTLLHKSYGIH